MFSSRKSSLSWLYFVALTGILLSALAGCKEEKITSYRAKKIHRRLLAAVVPLGDDTWFFKLAGPSDAVAEHKDEFEKFVGSVRFTHKKDPPIEWTPPADWKAEPGGAMRYATFRVGKQNLELTVTKLGAEAAALLPNVNRWRGQLGLPNIDEEQLPKLIRRDGPITFVDMSTTEAVVAEAPPRRPASGFKYDVPEGWKEQAGGGFAKAAFLVSDGDQQASVTLTPLAGNAGGMIANVQRWRTQVGLDAGTEAQVKNDLQMIECMGEKRPYADVAGPDGKRILGVIVERPGQTWFIKLTGPTGLVGKQKSAFEAFVRSLRLDGDRGAD